MHAINGMKTYFGLHEYNKKTGISKKHMIFIRIPAMLKHCILMPSTEHRIIGSVDGDYNSKR